MPYITTIVACFCMITLTYCIVQYLQFLKDEKIKHNNNVQKKINTLKMKKKDNVFRHMAIEQIANQKLVYDEKTGMYVRRTQID